MSEPQRFCRKCLLQDQGEAERASLSRYLEAIKPEDRVASDVNAKRLNLCRSCEQLAEDGTCLSCGCYVEFRAIIKTGRCPKKKW